MYVFVFVIGFLAGAALPLLTDLIAMLRKKWDN